ncbi:hypothetical protein [Psychromicrobium sp. YIM B11713]|uniref:hypothetical protein n=1 Tax=Psychromicrobium sp. YIM B11713 TaxID=3145233 RepID=UPI00374F4DDC
MLALVDHYGLTPSLAGIALTVGGVSWTVASVAQSRLTDRVSHPLAVQSGTILLCCSLLMVLLALLVNLPAAILMVAWVLAGTGMGFGLARLSTMGLSQASRSTQGAVSSALSMADSIGSAMALAVVGVLFGAISGASLEGIDQQSSFPLIVTLGISVLLATAGVVVSFRTKAQALRTVAQNQLMAE